MSQSSLLGKTSVSDISEYMNCKFATTSTLPITKSNSILLLIFKMFILNCGVLLRLQQRVILCIISLLLMITVGIHGLI